MSRQGSSYTISFDGGSVSRRNERFLRPVKIHEGVCEENDEADENTYSNMNVNPLADSADAAPRPPRADAGCPARPGGGGGGVRGGRAGRRGGAGGGGGRGRGRGRGGGPPGGAGARGGGAAGAAPPPEIVKERAYMNFGKETHLLCLAARHATQTVLAPLLESGTATETCVRRQ